MSEDPTKDIGQKYETKPTIETVVQMLAEIRDEMRAGFKRVDERFDGVESRLDDLSEKVKVLNGDVLQIRADLSRVGRRVESLETHFKEPA